MRNIPKIPQPILRQNPSMTNEQYGTDSQQSEQFNLKFYKQFKKLYKTSYLLKNQQEYLNNQKDVLIMRISAIKDKIDKQNKAESNRNRIDKKRVRRGADEIQRKHVCHGDKCGKSYGSEGSLVQHLKMKHPTLYRQSYEKNKQIQDSQIISQS